MPPLSPIFLPGHVPDTAAMLTQTHRILRPTGRLIVFDADHASTSFSLPDPRKGRDIDFKLVSAIATHPAICRQLPLNLKQANFEVCVCVCSSSSSLRIGGLQTHFPLTAQVAHFSPSFGVWQGRLLVIERSGVVAPSLAFVCRISYVFHSFSRLIPAMGILSEEEGRDWVDHMVRSHDDGTFFASGAFYTFHALKV
jgi:hypothetical protein